MAASTSALPLERGKACLRCRRRKMRCDGIRPMCGQCIRANESECEYTDAGPTPSQILERNVADLEARIRELEGRNSEAITLHDPHAAYRRARSSSERQSPSASDHPSQQVTQAVFNSFIQHAPNFGFFMNMSRFVSGLRLRTSSPPIPPALEQAAQLIGILFVDDSRLKAQESKILSHLLQSLSSAMSNVDPSTIIYVLQAEVLLAHYFFHKNRRLEGGYHATACVTIAVACNLHNLRSSRPSSSLRAPMSARYTLPHAADDIEEGERINAFWIIFSLDRCWTVMLRSQSVLARQDFMTTQIDTPWPLDMHSYEQGQLNRVPRSSTQTVRNFLGNVDHNDFPRSLLATRAKAAILFERAADLAGQWKPNAPGFQARFLSLDNRIEQFKSSLPTPSSFQSSTSAGGPGTDVLRVLLFMHTLIQCAIIQLHTPLQQEWDITNSRTLAAASAAAELLQVYDVRTFGYVDAIMGVLWSSIAQVLIRGLITVRSLRAVPATPGMPVLAMPVHALLPAEIMITTCLDRIHSAMETLSVNSPLIEGELVNLRQARLNLLAA